MRTSMLVAAVGVALSLASGAGEGVATADDSGALTRLVDDAAERLQTADPVAASKYLTGGAVDDPVREQEVIDSVTAGADAKNIDSDFVHDVFRNQIDATDSRAQPVRPWKINPGQLRRRLRISPDLEHHRHTERGDGGRDCCAMECAARQDVPRRADAALDAGAAERLGISVTDLHCLNIVEQGGGVTAGRLATESGLTTGAVTSVVDRLERAGYARRVRDQTDRRKVNVEVTPRFYERAEEVWGPIAADWERELGARFSAAQLDHDRRLPRTGPRAGSASLRAHPGVASPRPRCSRSTSPTS